MPLINRTTLIQRLKEALKIIRGDLEQCGKKQQQSMPESIDVRWLKECPDLMRLKRIVSDEAGTGIWGDREVFDRLNKYVREQLCRPHIADTLYCKGNRIKTSVRHNLIFKH